MQSFYGLTYSNLQKNSLNFSVFKNRRYTKQQTIGCFFSFPVKYLASEKSRKKYLILSIFYNYLKLSRLNLNISLYLIKHTVPLPALSIWKCSLIFKLNFSPINLLLRYILMAFLSMWAHLFWPGNYLISLYKAQFHF